MTSKRQKTTSPKPDDLSDTAEFSFSEPEMGEDVSQFKLFSKFILEMILGNPKQLATTLILSVLSTVAQIGLVFFVFILIKAGGGELTLFSIKLSGAKLWIIPALFAIGAAIIPYVVDRYIIRQTVLFFKKSIRDIANALSETHQRYKLFIWAENNSILTRILSSDARYASLAYAGILRLVFPITISLTSFGVLFLLNAKWTLGLAILVVPFLYWQLKVVASGTVLNRNLRQAGTAHGQAAAKFVGALSTHFAANRRGETLSQASDHLITEDFPNAYGERLKLGISTRLVGDFAVVGLILVICGLVITGNFTLENFSNIFIYAVVVRFAMTNLSRIATETISIISQVPFYENYVSAKNVLENQKFISDENMLEPEHVDPPYDSMEPDQLNVIFSSLSLDWIFIFKFLTKRTNFDLALRTVGQTLMASGRFRNFSNEFIEELRLSPFENEEEFLEIFPNSGHRWADFNLATSHADNVDKAWAEIPRPIKFLCSLHFAERKKQSGSFVFINGADYLALTADEKDWVRTIFEDTHILVIFNRIFVQRLVADVSGYFLMTSDGKLHQTGEDEEFDEVANDVKRLLEYEKQEQVKELDLFD